MQVVDAFVDKQLVTVFNPPSCPKKKKIECFTELAGLLLVCCWPVFFFFWAQRACLLLGQLGRHRWLPSAVHSFLRFVLIDRRSAVLDIGHSGQSSYFSHSSFGPSLPPSSSPFIAARGQLRMKKKGEKISRGNRSLVHMPQYNPYITWDTQISQEDM